MLINKNQRIYLYLFCIFSLIISFIIGENSSGGSKLDNQITRQYIDGFLTGYSFGIKYFINTSQVQSPIFYIIIATLEKILGKFFLQYFYIFITSLIPIIFYISLKKKFRNVNRNYLFFLSLIFFLSPFFRSSAVWITTDNLAILFYILSISKYLSSKKNNTKNILQCLTYLSIAVYLRQYYIIFFLFYFIKFIELLNVKKLFLISLFQLLIFIPLLFYYYYYLQFDMSKLNIVNLDSHPFKLDPFKNLLIFLSLYFFYTLPLYANVLLEIKRDIIKYFFYNLILVFIFIFIYFSYEIIFDELGGGVFVKISKILYFSD